VEPKRIVRADSLSKPTGPKIEELVAPPAPEAVKPRWKFVKLHAPGQELVFKDGSRFTFRKVQGINSTFWPNSDLITEDEKLAENLRQLPAGFGVVEVPAK